MIKIFLSLWIGLSLAAAAQAQTLPAAFSSTAPAGRVLALARQGSSQLQQALFQDYVNGAWADSARALYLRYAGPGQPEEVQFDTRQNSSWVKVIVNRARYNSAGLVLTDTSSQFIVLPHGPVFATVNTYNTPTQLQWSWSSAPRAGSSPVVWDSLQRTLHTYNATGQLAQLLHQLYLARTLHDESHELFTYNAQGQLTSEETQNAALLGGAWQPVGRTTHTYNAAGKEQQAITEKAGATGVYTNATRETWQYDGQNRTTVLVTDTWTNNAWQAETQDIYAYTAAGEVTSVTSQNWNSKAFVNSSRVVFTYQVGAATRRAVAARRLVVVPNPSSAADGPARLLLEASTAGATGAVYDQLGRQVAALVATPGQAQRGVLALPAGLPAGLYVVRLQGAGQQWLARWQNL